MPSVLWRRGASVEYEEERNTFERKLLLCVLEEEICFCCRQPKQNGNATIATAVCFPRLLQSPPKPVDGGPGHPFDGKAFLRPILVRPHRVVPAIFQLNLKQPDGVVGRRGRRASG